MTQRTFICFIVLSAILCCTAAAQQNTPTAPPAPAAKDVGTDLVVARVAGDPLTESQLVIAINQLASQRRLPLDQLQQRNAILFKDALENLVAFAVLINQARLEHLTVDHAKTDQQVQQISQRYPSPEAFQKALASEGITEAILRKNIEDSMSAQMVIDKALKDVPGPTDAEIAKFYDDNPDKFAVPEQVHAAHILLLTDPKSTPEQKADIEKKLEGIRADIESKTITFAEAAAKYSQDKSSAQKGGDLGFFSRGRLVKPFEEAAFATLPGTLSPVVETQFGYHIIQVLEVKPAHKASLEDGKTAIRQFLDQVNKQKATQKYVQDLRAETTVETFMTQEEFVKRHPAK